MKIDAEAQSLCALLNEPVMAATHPSEDARDTARLEWWYAQPCNQHSGGLAEWRKRMDAAMAQESGDAT